MLDITPNRIATKPIKRDCEREAVECNAPLVAVAVVDDADDIADEDNGEGVDVRVGNVTDGDPDARLQNICTNCSSVMISDGQFAMMQEKISPGKFGLEEKIQIRYKDPTNRIKEI